METADEFEYLRQCFYESMRIDPPVTISSSNYFNQDVTIDGVKIRAGDGFFVNIRAVHHDKTEWKEHDKYIPERFDCQSEYFLRPDGKH
eukprot:CAMPEP_0176398312 /NCGR_PEP_ID=MMETSP0126-20121128/45835_1 /TAXON_ID=141414 ORGANISM="Strombidinopsis acuminatum, Strain SPMC142" /NCGR_SAMPLE_ID=MMETSP0126 /ASSEMBLY_ACC=CAM_ASM_000229 /LENGTH=88 /DNA_ID=CAMNT_0017773169 /DNA_START=1086 /DNA_END=1349 /DNA_ORIENTATION=+